MNGSGETAQQLGKERAPWRALFSNGVFAAETAARGVVPDESGALTQLDKARTETVQVLQVAREHAQKMADEKELQDKMQRIEEAQREADEAAERLLREQQQQQQQQQLQVAFETATCRSPLARRTAIATRPPAALGSRRCAPSWSGGAPTQTTRRRQTTCRRTLGVTN